MSLSSEEKGLIADSVAMFAAKMILSANKSPEEIRADLTDFHGFICGALEAAMRDGRREALTTTLN
jgi:pyrroline-5-carboxylate reductase